MFLASHVYFFVRRGTKSMTKLDGWRPWPDSPGIHLCMWQHVWTTADYQWQNDQCWGLVYVSSRRLIRYPCTYHSF